MNLILTTDCQRKCSYCFAKDNQNNPMQFTMENLMKAIFWLEQEKHMFDRIALLGGEPTIHPQFIEFLEYLLPRRLGILVFTNGMIENIEIYSKIVDVASRNGIRGFPQLGFCVNINESKYRIDKEEALQTLFFEKLGKVSMLSFNIFEEKFDPYFLIEKIKKYSLIKSIRLGIAAPLGNRNNYLKIESFSKVSSKIVSFMKEATKQNIYVGFDCGFVRCMFSEEDLLDIKDLCGNITFDCGPSIDIYPNLEISSCYPMSTVLREKMENYKSPTHLFSYWQSKFNDYKPVYDRCETCNYFSNLICNGGCKAYKANG
jgi:radical SAM protein with 4Fe4S-binding SPASM domain